MRLEKINSSLFVKNREKLRGLLKPDSIVILHSNDIMPTNADGEFPFKQNADLLYLTGINQEETILVLYPDAISQTQKEILFIKEQTEHVRIWQGEKLSVEQAREQSGIENVIFTQSFEGTIHNLIQQASCVYLHVNEFPQPDDAIQTRNDRYREGFIQEYPLHRIERLTPLMKQLRPIKDEIEIDLIKKACEITEIGFRRVLKSIKPGVGEWQIEAEYAHSFINAGAQGFAYGPIIASGSNAIGLHYYANENECKDGEMVLMDVASEYLGWNADMTRTVPVNGKFTPRQREVYSAVLRVLRRANEILRPGIMPNDYRDRVEEFMEEELISLKLIDAEAAKQQDASKPLVKKYFMHGTSHHIGLDVHDISRPQDPVAVGNVFTIEPAIYISEENLGVRLENCVLIGEHDNTDLMQSIPIEIEEIESLMKGEL